MRHENPRATPSEIFLPITTPVAGAEFDALTTGVGQEQKGLLALHSTFAAMKDFSERASRALKNLDRYSDEEKLTRFHLFREIGDGFLESSRESARQTIGWLENLKTHAPEFVDVVTERQKAVAAFLTKLPEDITKVVITGENSFLNNKENDSRTVYYQIHTLLDAQARLETEGVKTSELVRMIRAAHPEVMNSPVFQQGFEERILAGLDYSVRQAVALRPLECSKEPVETFSLGSYFAFGLPANTGANVRYVGSAEDVELTTVAPLFTAMVLEIVTNAREATYKRFTKEGKERPFSCSPEVAVSQDNEQVCISIRDFGDPDEYSTIRGLGQSGPAGAREGFGVGRFRAQVIASLLGGSIAHRATENGDGSIIDIKLPTTPQ